MRNSEMTIEFNGIEFDGLKFKENFKDFPYKTKLEKDKYCDDLYEEGGEYNLIRYKKLIQLDYTQRIHISLSYAMVFKVLSFVLLAVLGILGFFKLLMPGLIVLGIGIACLLVYRYLNIRANDLFVSKDEVCGMIEFAFDNKK